MEHIHLKCKEWIIDGEAPSWTSDRQMTVSNCADLSHHFIFIINSVIILLL